MTELIKQGSSARFDEILYLFFEIYILKKKTHGKKKLMPNPFKD
jgi:hypothetical protein